MSRFRISSSIGAAAFSLFLAVAPAQALNTVSFVSSWTGRDDSPCSTPEGACQTINKALERTEPGGEIKCLDNHVDFIFLAIEKPITIDCGAPGTLLVGGFGIPAITIDLDEATYPNGVVTLRNLNVSHQIGVPPGTDGIGVIGGGAAVHVENCNIQGFPEQGIDFAPSSSVDLFVRDTNISNNAGGGVLVHPAAAAIVRGSVSNANLDQNGGVGLVVEKTSGATTLITVGDTQAEKNVVGLRAIGVRAFIALSASTVAYNMTGLQTLDGGTIVSSRNNTVLYNGTNGTPTSTIPLK